MVYRLAVLHIPSTILRVLACTHQFYKQHKTHQLYLQIEISYMIIRCLDHKERTVNVIRSLVSEGFDSITNSSNSKGRAHHYIYQVEEGITSNIVASRIWYDL